MKKLAKYFNKNVGVLGLGKSGKAAVKFLLHSKAFVFAYDDNIKIQKELKNCNWKHFSNWDWKNLSCVVISPGIKICGEKKHEVVNLAKQHKVKIINEIQLLMDQKPEGKIIGITGTNGKSTLVSLISHILTKNNIKNSVGGNIGIPGCLISEKGDKSVIVLELSSYQLLSIPSLKLDISTIINITPDHLDFHQNFNSYKNAKLSILKFLKKDGKFIFNSNDDFLRPIIQSKVEKKKIIKVSNSKKPPYINNIQLTGHHNTLICNIATEICKLIGIKKNDIYKSINNYVKLPHRTEVIYNSKKLLIVNDSKATNGDSTAAALSSYKNILWIAGGLAKKNGIKKPLENIQNVLHIYLIGSSKKLFKKQICNINSIIPMTECDTLETAVNSIFNQYKKFSRQITILFSPAAASFDEYKNFEHRGNQFKKIIVKLLHQRFQNVNF